jgi:hypothetical protein
MLAYFSKDDFILPAVGFEVLLILNLRIFIFVNKYCNNTEEPNEPTATLHYP